MTDTSAMHTDPLAERTPSLSANEARVAAARCLYCHDAPCMHACPTQIDIPSFIRLLETGDRLSATRVIMESNVLGATCARVCAVEQLCEGACVLAPGEGPVEIGRLQRWATDIVLDDADGFSRAGLRAGADTGRSVAVIGGGPAGLAAAAHLRMAGHRVTVFERHERLGGLAAFGIIPLREPANVVAWEAAQIVELLGADIRVGCTVGRDIDIAAIGTAFDAVVVATGAGARVAPIRLDGVHERTTGVQDALAFIEQVRRFGDKPGVHVGRDVVVIGAGNTAMDAATLAARLWARSVTCVYRRTRAEMTGYPLEYEHCVRDGVLFRWLLQPVAVTCDAAGAVTALDCVDVELGPPDQDGRRAPQLTDAHTTISCDHILLATGQQREMAIFEQLDVTVSPNGTPVTDNTGVRTTRDGVWVIGDAVLAGNKLSVVDAVASARTAAHDIDEYLRTSGVAP